MKATALPERRRAAIWIAALVAVWGAYFGAVVLARGYLFFGDITWQDHPLRVFYTGSLRAGHLPLWNPYLFGGFPQFAEGQTAALYPLSVLAAFLLQPHVAITWLVVIHRLLAGLFMFLLARGWGLARSSAFLAGLVFMASGWLFVQSQHWGYASSAAYIPLLLYFIEIGLRKQRAAYALPAGMVLAIQFLLGAPPITYLSVFCAVVYAALRAAALRTPLRSVALLVPGTLLIGCLLGAIQILPSLDLAGHSTRAAQSRLEYMTSFALPPRLLALFVAPNTWGNPALGNYRGPQYYWEYCAYLGLLAPMLAGVALVRRWREYWSLAALAALALALAVGRLNPIYYLLQHVPGVNLFRVPARYLLVVTICLSLLAGAGHQVLLERVRGAARPARWLLLCLAALGGWAVVTFALLPPEGRYTLSSAIWLPSLAVILLLLSAETLVAGAWNGAFTRPVLTGLAAVVILADLLPWGASQLPTTDAAYFTDPPASAKALRGDTGWFRIMTRRPMSGPMSPDQWQNRSVYPTLREQLAPDLPLAYRIQTLEGYSALYPARQVVFLHLLQRAFSDGDVGTRLLDAAGVKYLISEQPLHETGLTLVHSGVVHIYRNPGFLGPCWVVPLRHLPAVSPTDFMAGEGFLPDRTAALGRAIEPLTPDPGALRAEARLVGFEPTRIEIEASTNQPALLVINAAAYDSDWKATLDGEAAPVYPANQMFQAVRLPAGRHRVVLRYHPVAYVVGRGISGASAGLIVLALVWGARRKRRPRTADSRATLGRSGGGFR